MSTINFAALRTEHPELSAAWSALAQWIRTNPEATFLDPRRLAIDLDALTVRELTEALVALASKGEVTPKFVVRDPTGIIVEKEFDSVKEIPRSLPNRTFDHYFKVRRENIVPIYKLAEVEANP